MPSIALFSNKPPIDTLSSVFMPRTATLFADEASCNQHSTRKPAAAELVDWPAMWHATHLKDGRAVSDQVAFPVVIHGAARRICDVSASLYRSESELLQH